MGLPRQEHRSGLAFPSPEDLPDPAIKPQSPALADGFFTAELDVYVYIKYKAGKFMAGPCPRAGAVGAYRPGTTSELQDLEFHPAGSRDLAMCWLREGP